MSAQQRYLTLVQHISKIYSADDGGINELADGLKDILTRINPVAASDWKKVHADSKRLLRVWHSCADDDDAAADEVVDQIADSLKEFSAGEIQLVADAPTLVVSEVAAAAPAPPVYKMVAVEVAEEDDEDEEEEEEEEEAPTVVVVKKAAEAPATADSDDEESVVEPEPDHDGDIKMLIEEMDAAAASEEEEEVEEDGGMDLEDTPVSPPASGGTVPMDEDEAEVEEAVAEAEAEEEEDAEAAAAVVEEAKEAEEANKAAESEDVVEPADDEEAEEEEAEEEEAEEEEAEEEEEEAEEEEAEEEEEGLEVEKRVIRGRPYWVDVNTNKLYAVVGDDDVGDEVGAIINNKPVFRA